MRLFRPHVRITLAGAVDAPALAALYARCWPSARDLDAEAPELRPEVADVEAWFRGGFEVYRATLDGELAGAVRISFPTGAAMLDMLAVDPQQRRRGVGRALVQHALGRARKAGVRRAWVHLTTQLQAALALHRELGFRESARRPRPDGAETVLLELVL